VVAEIELIIQPDEDEPEAASVFVDGSLNGKPYRFLLDTGAARSTVLINEDTAALQTVGSHHSSGVFHPLNDDLVSIERLEIGAIVKHNFTVARSPSAPGTRNLIGMDLLSEFCCHFQFDRNRVEIDTLCHHEHSFQPLCVDKGLHPYLDVVFEHEQGSVVWDTGASLTVGDLNFIQRHPSFFQPTGHSIGTDATGSQVETPMFLMKSAQIGGYRFPAHKIAAVDLSQVNARIEKPMDLILGYMTLRKANWLFDFPRRQWTITQWFGG
jgi:hypothetical protein